MFAHSLLFCAESDTALETAGKCDNTSSIINDAAMFVSMLDDSEDGLSSSAGINGKETDNEVNGNTTGASMMEFVSGCVSSEELFSTATTANGSVIFVSSNSVAQPTHAQNTSVSPSKISPIHIIEHLQEVNAPSDYHSTPLFSCNGSVVMDTADPPTKPNGEPMDIDKPISGSNCISNISPSKQQSSDVCTSESDSSSDGELSGSSNDDTEFLSNSQYQHRKRKRPLEIDTTSSKKAARKNSTVTVQHVTNPSRNTRNIRKTRKTRRKTRKTRGYLTRNRKRNRKKRKQKRLSAKSVYIAMYTECMGDLLCILRCIYSESVT